MCRRLCFQTQSGSGFSSSSLTCQLQAVELSATTAAGVVGKTVAKSVVEARSQGLQSTVPKRSPQQSRSLLVLEFSCVKVSAACKEGRELKERRSECGRLI